MAHIETLVDDFLTFYVAGEIMVCVRVTMIWDHFHEKGPNAYIIKFLACTIEV